MQRLTVGQNRGYGSFNSYSRGGVRRQSPPRFTPEKSPKPVSPPHRDCPPPKAPPQSHKCEQTFVPPPEKPHAAEKRDKAPPLFPFLQAFSPDKPLFVLGKREIFAEDLLLILLIFVLLQEQADKSLIAALIYILAE